MTTPDERTMMENVGLFKHYDIEGDTSEQNMAALRFAVYSEEKDEYVIYGENGFPALRATLK